MNLKKFIPQRNSIKNLQNESEGIIEVFTSTVSKLEIINQKIEEEVEEKEEQISALNNEVAKLADIKLKNSTIMTKISALFTI